MLLKLSHPKNKKKFQGNTYLIKKLLMTIWRNFRAFFLNCRNISWGWFLQEWLSVRCRVCDTITITKSSYFFFRSYQTILGSKRCLISKSSSLKLRKQKFLCLLWSSIPEPSEKNYLKH